MSISDEWETPEKQDFKDFVSVTPQIKCSTAGSRQCRSQTPTITNCVTNGDFNCPRAQGNMRHWIEDADCRDHFSVIYESGERTAIFANDAKEAIVVEERAVSAGGFIS